MPDREKVIKGLECCLVFGEDLLYKCDECPYRATEDERKVIDWRCHLEELRKDALELLKGQEPLTIQSGRIDEIYNNIAECPECGMEWAMWLPDKMRYCPGCGKAVKWSDTCRR